MAEWVDPRPCCKGGAPVGAMENRCLLIASPQASVPGGAGLFNNRTSDFWLGIWLLRIETISPLQTGIVVN